MRVLIDTNIIIHREANRIYNPDIGFLFNWIDKLKLDKIIHPYSIEEISRYEDESVVSTIKAKLHSYNLLKTISKDTDQITLVRSRDKSRNEVIDTDIVKEVYNERVDFLISEDRGIHHKARYLGIAHKVYRISDFIDKCISENPKLKDYKVLAVRKEYFGNIEIDNEFFDSFKADYSEFRAWFNSKADNEAYICEVDGSLSAFLYLKIENSDEIYGDISPSFEPKKRLKIGTLKVTSNGLKIGERFLKIIFDNAALYRVDEIYVTIFNKREEQLRLIQLLEDWGFSEWGLKKSKNGDELVFVKSLDKKVNIRDPRLTYPYVARSTSKWIVPIYPEYHTELFPDSYLNNESPASFRENEPHRNAIKKVYVSRSINRDLNSGDLILFYRTGGHHAGVVSTIGVVENVITNINSEDMFISLCRKRSVFTDEGLSKFWNYNRRNRPFIVNFLYVDSFPKPKVNLGRLRELNVIQDAPRGFEPLDDDKFFKIIKEARANENYFID